MIEFEINGVQYRAQTMDARRQFHVARRLSSVFGPSTDALSKVKSDTDTKTSIVAAINGFFDALGTLPDDQLDYVIDACLDTVSRKDGGAWSPIRRGGAMMYDLDLYTQGAIVYHVVRGQLDGFFASLPAPVRDMLKGAATGLMARAMEQPSGD
jgi:hypothetical protein